MGGSFAALNGPLSRELNKRNADAVRSLGVVNAVIDPGPNQTGWADKLRYVESGDLVVVLELGGNGPPTNRGIVAVDRAIFAKRATPLWVVADEWPEGRLEPLRALATSMIRHNVALASILGYRFRADELDAAGIHLKPWRSDPAPAVRLADAILAHPAAAAFRAFFPRAGAPRVGAITLAGIQPVQPRGSARSRFRPEDLDRLARYKHIFIAMGLKYDLPPRYLAALCFQESRWVEDKVHYGIRDGRRVTGAHGISGLLPSTAGDHPIPGTTPITWETRSRLFNPAESVEITAIMISELKRRRGGLTEATYCYRAGCANIDAHRRLRSWASLAAPPSTADRQRNARAAFELYVPGIEQRMIALAAEGLL